MNSVYEPHSAQIRPLASLLDNTESLYSSCCQFEEKVTLLKCFPPLRLNLSNAVY